MSLHWARSHQLINSWPRKQLLPFLPIWRAPSGLKADLTWSAPPFSGVSSKLLLHKQSPRWHPWAVIWFSKVKLFFSHFPAFFKHVYEVTLGNLDIFLVYSSIKLFILRHIFPVGASRKQAVFCYFWGCFTEAVASTGFDENIKKILNMIVNCLKIIRLFHRQVQKRPGSGEKITIHLKIKLRTREAT